MLRSGWASLCNKLGSFPVQNNFSRTSTHLRTFTSSTTTRQHASKYLALKNTPENLKYFDFSNLPISKEYNREDFLVFPEFITEKEHEFLIKQTEKKLKRVAGAAYLDGHFDRVINKYRECTATHWGGEEEKVNEILQRVKDIFPDEYQWLPPHILDLHAEGCIDPHVDNLEASGHVITCLNLMNPTMFIMEHKDDPNIHFEVFVNPRTLYIQRNTIRYNFAHSIPNTPEKRVFKGEPVPQARRIGLLLRDVKKPEA
ncbi:hypothetical protein K7432_002407 [Basidiobolus ranarum]|uniref:Alpha-ketoglutarate-dependent dioxygenase AlkB-like domain-containing protein n=1 Tax=Basidiobolus ranarum TaxID=34480 RepID=A0ABR2X1N1_9FUNG